MIPTPTRRRRPCALPSLLFMALLTAQAQAQPTTTTATATTTTTTTTRPDPLDPKARVPAMRYESSIGLTRAVGDDKPVTWRDANDAVTRIGGWRVYAREAQQPDAAAADKPATAPAQAPASAPPAAVKPNPAAQPGHKH